VRGRSATHDASAAGELVAGCQLVGEGQHSRHLVNFRLTSSSLRRRNAMRRGKAEVAKHAQVRVERSSTAEHEGHVT